MMTTDRQVRFADRKITKGLLLRLRNAWVKLPEPFAFPPPHDESCRNAFCELGKAIDKCEVRLTLMWAEEDDD